jgi:hypothetical protein
MTEKVYHNNRWHKWVTILLSPFVVSFLASVLLIILFFPAVSKYKISIYQSYKIETELQVYDDLTGDRISDRITFRMDTAGFYSVIVYQNPSGLMNQWNFEGKLLTGSNDFMITGDFDNNKQKELYFFSLRHDSILLQCISDYNKNTPEFKDVFIAHVGFRKGNYEASIRKAEMDDLNDDGYKELIFAVNSGFSLTPRSVFAYDIHHRKCLASPYLGLSMTRLIQKDITGDGKNEILIQGHGADNISDTTVKYHDRSAWLIVLDRKLDFLFKPIEFKGAYSHIWPFVFEYRKGLNQAGFYVRSTAPPAISKLCYFSADGKITKETNLPGMPYNGIFSAFPFIVNDKPYLALTQINKDEMLVYDVHLQKAERKNIPAFGTTAWLDIDNDGQNEIISTNSEQSKLTVIRSNLQDPVSIDLPFSVTGIPHFSLKQNGKEDPELFIWDHSSTALLNYRFNPLFYWKWAIYIGIYLSILLFTWLIRRIQRYQIEQKMQIEKKITELQMKIVKNQLDPHFTLNAVNSIIYAVNNNEPERATEHLHHFSSLYRHLLLTADQYKCALKDELTFTENYLKMEQLRFRDKYRYEINIDERVDTELEVPKMCIQTAAENAVKHGIFQLKEGGVITVNAVIQQDRLVIEVSDNGIGREASKKLQTSSTRKGNQLTQQYFDLYTKITNRKVTSEIVDLTDDSGNAAGTKVVISIQLN